METKSGEASTKETGQKMSEYTTVIPINDVPSTFLAIWRRRQ
jgi:hypothetical protein